MRVLLEFIKMLAISAGLLAVTVLVGGTLLLYIAFKPSREEVASVRSPDQSVIATLIETNGGATTSFGYEVRLAVSQSDLGSTRVAYLYGATRSRVAYGVNLWWASSSELNIEYLDARSAELVKAEVRMASRTIRIALKPNVTDPSAPGGGMHYYLNSRQSGEP